MLFFVSVGMLFDPAVLLSSPLQVLIILALIVVAKPLAALAIVALLRQPLSTGLIVAAGLAKRCTVQLAYAIGVAKPLSLYVDTHGTGTVGDDAIETAIGAIAKLGSMTPRGIRTHLGLNKPIYEKTAAYGHFGRDVDGDFFPWEKLDLVDDLKAALVH